MLKEEHVDESRVYFYTFLTIRIHERDLEDFGLEDYLRIAPEMEKAFQGGLLVARR